MEGYVDVDGHFGGLRSDLYFVGIFGYGLFFWKSIRGWMDG